VVAPLVFRLVHGPDAVGPDTAEQSRRFIVWLEESRILELLAPTAAVSNALRELLR